jgi:hypothetical protein
MKRKFNELHAMIIKANENILKANNRIDYIDLKCKHLEDDFNNIYRGTNSSAMSYSEGDMIFDKTMLHFTPSCCLKSEHSKPETVDLIWGATMTVSMTSFKSIRMDKDNNFYAEYEDAYGIQTRQITKQCYDNIREKLLKD